MKTDIESQLKALSDKIDDISNDDLELDYSSNDKNHSQMLEVNPSQTDSYGDSVELMTKTRLQNYHESYEVAFSFVQREYHTMVGNRYGKHSKLIPVYDNHCKKTRLDMVWFSGNDIKIVTINGKEYYKVRLLVYDILVKKLLLSRIPTSDGKARQEEIEHKGAGIPKGQNNLNIMPMQPLKYKSDTQNNSPGKTGQILFEESK